MLASATLDVPRALLLVATQVKSGQCEGASRCASGSRAACPRSSGTTAAATRVPAELRAELDALAAKIAIGALAGPARQLLAAVALVALRGIRKRFGATEALRGADLELEPGSVHALLGENGAGKTTLVRVLFGSVRPDAGEIERRRPPVAIDGPRARARARASAWCTSTSCWCPRCRVAENLVLGEAGAALAAARRACTRARARS